MFPQTRQCKKHSLNSSLKLAKTKNALRHQSCNINSCGDYCVATTSRYVEILYLKHFYKHIVFTGEGDKIRNKVIKDYINVSVVIDIECGDTRNE